jgi:hypothetical protein
MPTYIDKLPEELSAKIYHIYMNNLVDSSEFKSRRRSLIIRRLQKQLSQKQLRQLGI